MSNNRKNTAEMIAELLRDAGMLVLVFLPLDAIYAERTPSWARIIAAVLVGVGAIAIGIFMERVRK